MDHCQNNGVGAREENSREHVIRVGHFFLKTGCLIHEGERDK